MKKKKTNRPLLARPEEFQLVTYGEPSKKSQKYPNPLDKLKEIREIHGLKKRDE